MEMLQIMPVVFILTSILEAWVPKEMVMNSFGEKAALKGNVFSFLLGSLSAGPIYAAFPISKMLLKKGASITNIVIILSSWAVVKVPMLANEGKFLGIKFMGLRWVLTTISIFLMAYVTARLVKIESIPLIRVDGDRGLTIEDKYCIGCGICAAISPESFSMDNNKAKILKGDLTNESLEDISRAIEKCPSKAISL